MKHLNGAACIGLVVNIDKAEELNIIVLLQKGFGVTRRSFLVIQDQNDGLAHHSVTTDTL